MGIADLTGRKVGVLGFGQEGKAVTAYLLRHGITPVLFDKRSRPEFGPEDQSYLASHNIEQFLGPAYLDNLDQVEVIFRSPGTWRRLPPLVTAEKKGLVVTSQAKWFFDHAPGPIIGVTGTKGKGTTASLIAHILRAASDSQVYLTGNVGQIQPLDFLDDLKPGHSVVYELSSFQLQDLGKSPHIGVVLMVTRDHLEVHSSVKEYHGAKEAITKFQQPQDFAIINNDFAASQAIGELGAAKKIYFSRVKPVSNGGLAANGELMVHTEEFPAINFDISVVPLRGQHNWDNITAAILASLYAGAEPDAISSALPTFVGLPHRLQQLPTQNGVQFFDDSISTVPDTAQAAIQAFTEPVIIIVGGADKGVDPQPLIEQLCAAANIKAVVAVGTTGAGLADAVKARGFGGQILRDFSDNLSGLEQAMRAIKKIAAPGDVVLLSPGYTSLDWYPNYRARGEHFAELAGKWESL